MNKQPWTCPKCGRVYGPSWPECGPCNFEIASQKTNRVDKCLACGWYHVDGMQCPKYKVTSASIGD